MNCETLFDWQLEDILQEHDCHLSPEDGCLCQEIQQELQKRQRVTDKKVQEVMDNMFGDSMEALRRMSL